MINEVQKRMARHALGLPNDRNRSYRNGYAITPDHPDFSQWEALVNLGMATVGFVGLVSKITNFHLTEIGALLALVPGESLDPEDFE